MPGLLIPFGEEWIRLEAWGSRLSSSERFEEEDSDWGSGGETPNWMSSRTSRRPSGECEKGHVASSYFPVWT